MGVANVACGERDGRDGVGYRVSGVVFPCLGRLPKTQSEFQSRSHANNSTIVVRHTARLAVTDYATDWFFLAEKQQYDKVSYIDLRFLQTRLRVTYNGEPSTYPPSPQHSAS